MFTALENLGFGEFKEDVEEIAKTCKEKRRRQSTRLEDLGIPEEELYRQQQELFAKVFMIWNRVHDCKHFAESKPFGFYLFLRHEKNKRFIPMNNGKRFRWLR